MFRCLKCNFDYGQTDLSLENFVLVSFFYKYNDSLLDTGLVMISIGYHLYSYKKNNLWAARPAAKERYFGGASMNSVTDSSSVHSQAQKCSTKLFSNVVTSPLGCCLIGNSVLWILFYDSAFQEWSSQTRHLAWKKWK